MGKRLFFISIFLTIFGLASFAFMALSFQYAFIAHILFGLLSIIFSILALDAREAGTSPLWVLGIQILILFFDMYFFLYFFMSGPIV
jgi:hypothetical protein